MCGFVGWLEFNGHIVQQELELMGSKISHRGPDACGSWVSPERHVGLLHKRLSIVDLTKQANQPMTCGDRYVLVFNGEIYNHQALRVELIRQGVSFNTDHSDTEVLLNACAYWGVEVALAKLEGMFAFALYDRHRQEIYLARDRLGEKPLYYFNDGKRFLFGSEIKAILRHRAVTPKLNEQALVDYLSFRTCPAPTTFFAGISKLPAAHYIKLDLKRQKCETHRYWNLLTTPKSDLNYQQLSDEVETLLDSKVKDMMEADVPVGVFLSGGVDSTLLLSQMSKHKKGINCFNIAYTGDSQCDETSGAIFAANENGAVLHRLEISAEQYLEKFKEVVYCLDEPSAAPITVSQYFLSELARKHDVPVVFVGEGADEAFLGYPLWTQVQNMHSKLGRFPKAALPLAALGAKAIWPKKHRRCEYFNRAARSQPLFWGGVEDFTPEQNKKLLSNVFRDINESTYDRVIKPHWEAFEQSEYADDIYKWMTYLDSNIRLPELMLQRMDRMSMSHSIEGRAPFLNHKIFELAFSAPSQHLMNGTNKAVLKDIAAKRYGNEFVYRKKKGFSAPLSQWFGERFGSDMVSKLKEINDQYKFFEQDYMIKTIENDGRNNTLYFSLCNFALWHEVFLE